MGGSFTSAGGVPANAIAKWDGSSWSAVGGGLGGPFPFVDARAMAVFDDGSGPGLYVGGRFTSAGGGAANQIARWDGSSWTPLGSGAPNGQIVLALLSHYDGDDAALYAGGTFSTLPDSGDSFLGKWGCGFDSTPPTLACPAVVALERFGSAPGEFVEFDVAVEDDQDPAPSVTYVPPSGSFFPPGTTLVTCTATDAAGNESTCEFPVTVAPKARKP